MPTNRPGNKIFGYVVVIAAFCFCTICCAETAYSTNSAGATASVDSISESELRDELWSLVKSLRQLRTAYYEKQTKNTNEIEKYQAACDKLETELEELGELNESLCKNIADADKEISQLQTDIEKNDKIESSAAEKLRSFISQQTEIVEKGFPYRRDDRIERLNGKVPAKESASQDRTMSDLLGMVWSFSQEELRIARSGESYTGQVQTDQGRLEYARLFRVGHIVMGYITEQGGKSGIWVNGQGWKTASKSEADAIRQSLDILGRKQAPKYIQLPVYANPKHIKAEGK